MRSNKVTIVRRNIQIENGSIAEWLNGSMLARLCGPYELRIFPILFNFGLHIGLFFGFIFFKEQIEPFARHKRAFYIEIEDGR